MWFFLSTIFILSNKITPFQKKQLRNVENVTFILAYLHHFLVQLFQNIRKNLVQVTFISFQIL